MRARVRARPLPEKLRADKAGAPERLTWSGFAPYLLQQLVIAHGRPEEEDLEGEEPQQTRFELGAVDSGAKCLSPVSPGQDAACRLPNLRVVQGPTGSRNRLTHTPARR